MAQPPPWRTMYLSVTSEAIRSAARVKQSVAAARRDLASPLVLDTRDSEGRYTLLESALTHIDHASGSLSAFIINTVVAERLTLHGCGAVPSEPVARIGDLRDGHGRHDEWLALVRLQAAREHAEDALRRVEGAYTLLGSVRFMLHSQNPDAPGRRQAMEGQLHALDLQPVVVGVASMSALASLATQPPIRYRIQ
uniref:BTR1-like-2 protein n=1 Tax=Triticum monococcum subsp. aegilopoides TaxID=52163 RepID=A0A7U3W890_TRIMO|nr:BTR1-like-2 protein [Triticum monococcum subsp. aegilopoides]